MRVASPRAVSLEARIIARFAAGSQSGNGRSGANAERARGRSLRAFEVEEAQGFS
jgi:hypothetical protein